MSDILQHPELDGTSFYWPGNDTGVLFLHGLTATTVEVRRLAEHAHRAGYTVAGPLLPGHGTTPEDLARKKWQDWFKTASDAYQGLTLRCSRIFVAGESMGGLLTLYLASLYPEIAGIMLYAPAIQVKNLRWAQFMAYVRPFQAKKSINLEMQWQGYYVNSLHAAAELYKLQCAVRPRLPSIQTPALILQGLLDTTVEPPGAQYLYDHLGSKRKGIYWLERSTHVLILDQELDRVAQLTLNFIQTSLLEYDIMQGYQR